MKLYLDTDADQEFTLLNIQDIRISPEKTMQFVQEFVNLYKKVEGQK